MIKPEPIDENSFLNRSMKTWAGLGIGVYSLLLLSFLLSLSTLSRAGEAFSFFDYLREFSAASTLLSLSIAFGIIASALLGAVLLYRRRRLSFWILLFALVLIWMTLVDSYFFNGNISGSFDLGAAGFASSIGFTGFTMFLFYISHCGRLNHWLD